MNSTEFARVLGKYYFADFVPAGGSFVKFVIGSHSSLYELRQQLTNGEFGRFLTSTATANDGPLHPLSSTFFQVAKQIDWRTFARSYIRDILQRDDWELGDTDPTIESLAFEGGLTPTQCADRIDRLLADALFKRQGLVPEFKHAFAALVWASLDPSDYGKQDAEQIALDWLTGNLKYIHHSKPLHIHKKITISNARGVLISLCRLAKDAGFDGTLIFVDFSAYVTPVPGVRRYWPTHVVDFYETVRQFIDSIDELTSTVLCFLTTRDFIGESRLSFKNYEALRLRLTNEAFAIDRPNPLAPLVELDAQ